MSKSKSFLLLDDHPIVLQGIYYLLHTLYENACFKLCNQVDEALNLLNSNEGYDILIADLYMPNKNGFSLLQALRDSKIDLPVLILSSTQNKEDIDRAFSLGASGFISKDAISDEIDTAVKKLLSGGTYTPPWFEKTEAENTDSDILGILSLRQFDVLNLIEQGYTNRQIASILNISESTVKYHIKTIFLKLDVSTRTACVMEARHRGYIN